MNNSFKSTFGLPEPETQLFPILEALRDNNEDRARQLYIEATLRPEDWELALSMIKRAQAISANPHIEKEKIERRQIKTGRRPHKKRINTVHAEVEIESRVIPAMRYQLRRLIDAYAEAKYEQEHYRTLIETLEFIDR